MKKGSKWDYSMDRWLEIAADACDHAGLEVGSIETLVTWDQEHHQNAAYRLLMALGLQWSVARHIYGGMGSDAGLSSHILRWTSTARTFRAAVSCCVSSQPLGGLNLARFLETGRHFERHRARSDGVHVYPERFWSP